MPFTQGRKEANAVFLERIVKRIMCMQVFIIIIIIINGTLHRIMRKIIV